MISGVYQIYNNITKKSYVGSSKNIEKRFTKHRGLLRGNKHHSLKLQSAYNKYKEECFDFNILESNISTDFLKEREQYWIDNLDSYHNGYNAKIKAVWFESEKRPSAKKPLIFYKINSGELEFFDSVSDAMNYFGGPQFLSNIKEPDICKSYRGRWCFYKNNFNIDELKKRWDIKNAPHKLLGIPLKDEVKKIMSEKQKGKKFDSIRLEKMRAIRKLRCGHKVLRSDGQIFKSLRSAGEAVGEYCTFIKSVIKGVNRKPSKFGYKYLD